MSIELRQARLSIPALVVAVRSLARLITNGRVGCISSTPVITGSAVFVFGTGAVSSVVVRVVSVFTILMVMYITTSCGILYPCVIGVTGPFMGVESSHVECWRNAYLNSGWMAEVKSRKKSGTLRSQSEVKAQSNICSSRNDYRMKPLMWNIIPARGRDAFKGEKIVWTAVNMKLQNVWIKSQTDNKSIPYQRGAKSIARQILRETRGAVRLSVEETQDYIDGWYRQYPGVTGYNEWCKQRVNNPPYYIQNPWGRRRHFHKSDNNSTMAAQEREGINFTIQSTVAGALDMAVFNLWAYRKMHGMKYRLNLGIHDAVLAEVPFEEVEHYMDVVLPLCMVHGTRVPASEISPSFQIDIDPEVMFRWSEAPTRKQFEGTGVPERFWPKAA